jgi:hypothetical protein
MSDDDPNLTDRQREVLVSLRRAVRTAPTPLRSCGECAKCCEGWLSGAVYGHSFSPGRPCFFLEKTCSIYADRPLDPCRNYKCAWLSADTFPMWLKPSLANLVISNRNDEERGVRYYIVDQAGDTFDQRALNWVTQWATDTNVNVEYRINGDVRRVGAPEFVKE